MNVTNCKKSVVNCLLTYLLVHLGVNFKMMEKQEIANLLEEKHKDLFAWLDKQPVEKWEQGPAERWTTGQHIVHLISVMKRVNHVLSFPKFMLRYKFGKTNRELRDYNTVVEKYQTKLAKNKEKAKKFNAKVKAPNLQERKKLLTTLQIQQKKLQHKTKIWSDTHLDNLVLPHPLLGKLPVREMIMFIAHHTEHHKNTLEKDY